jgi:thioredoxin 1
MAMADRYLEQQPSRTEIDALSGATLLEFGTNWCGHCVAARAPIAAAFAQSPQLRHVMVEDGSGRALGRSFRVKLWPTLVFLRDGKEVARLVRPTTTEPIVEAMKSIRSEPPL